MEKGKGGKEGRLKVKGQETCYSAAKLKKRSASQSPKWQNREANCVKFSNFDRFPGLRPWTLVEDFRPQTSGL